MGLLMLRSLLLKPQPSSKSTSVEASVNERAPHPVLWSKHIRKCRFLTPVPPSLRVANKRSYILYCTFGFQKALNVIPNRTNAMVHSARCLDFSIATHMYTPYMEHFEKYQITRLSRGRGPLSGVLGLIYNRRPRIWVKHEGLRCSDLA